MNTAQRIARLREGFAGKGIDAMVVHGVLNRRYLSGFTGSEATLLITAERAYILVDFRYTEQAAAQAPVYEVVRSGGMGRTVIDLLRELLAGAKSLGFEGNTISFDQQQLWAKELGVQLVSVSGLVEGLRVIKDADEQAVMRRAAALADDCFHHILGYIHPGVREVDVAVEMEFFLRRGGAEGRSFDFIVASGQRSAMPHGVASEKLIEPGELVTLDFGCILDGYCSDMTRTLMVGEPDDEQRRIYNIVLEAQQLGVERIGPGMTGRQADAICRDHIAACGHGEAFGHGTGHGVGLEIHEQPGLSPRGESMLVPGQVITIEPGIYLPGWGGVRVEDIAIVTETGLEIMSHSPKELIILE